MVQKNFSQKTFFLDSKIEKAVEEDDVLRITGYASTKAVDRVGDTILPSAWSKGGLNNYKKNPIILFNHNYGAPIGKATQLEIDDNGLKISAVISKSSPQYPLIKDGVLSTFSVGFLAKDVEYDESNDGFIIKEAELLETSVVTVPCNQDACFSVAKSFENRDEFRKFLKELDIDEPNGQAAEKEVNTSKTGDNGETDGQAPRKEIKTMTPEEIQAMIAAEAKKLDDQRVAKELADKAAAAAKKAEDERVAATVATVVTAESEKLMAAFEAKLAEKNGDFETAIKTFETALAEKSAEIQAMQNSKRVFSDRTGGSTDLKAFEADIDNAFILARATADRGKKSIEDTAFGKSLLEKVNTHSTVSVSSAEFERMGSANLERDIQNELVVARMFREINMTAANMTVPIMPDAGYAEITANTTASGSAPNGNVDKRGATFGSPYDGVALTEINLNTIKMISLGYLGNETEEDAIIPILPLIRESMMRSHARGVENMILAGNDADGVYASGAKDGLIKLARTNSRMVTTAATNTPLTAASLFGLRKLMGKYGVNPRDLVYIVSQDAYFQLIEDAEFQDADLVGSDMATKLTGEIGKVYGSAVVMSDEFAAAGAGKFHALALNKRNFVIPRLRGLTVESDYEVKEQRRVLVTSQRLGFNEIIPNAPSVVGLRYALS
jgi:HK97 family phage prohead protease